MKRFIPCTLSEDQRDLLQVTIKLIAVAGVSFSDKMLRGIVPDLTASGLGRQDHMDISVAIDSPEFARQVLAALPFVRALSRTKSMSRRRNVWSIAKELTAVTRSQVCTGALVLALLSEGFTVERSRMGTGGSHANVSAPSVQIALKMLK